ncbi:protein of unknown function DUF547 [Dillenia turbinata]|uniref:Uncharacterized protein n=1 Tax=Dillenia turbinata TaxID=194707 RepID=A0AAN8VSB9_9MAGN
MNGFSVDENDWFLLTLLNALVIVCSASDRNLDVPRHGAPHCLHKDQNKAYDLTPTRRSCRARSPLSENHSSRSINTSLKHRASLEKDTKELIAEIELLEEEVANREQRVLSLYGSIFDNCVSRPPSEQSSGISSPAHTKNEGRKHPISIKDSGRSTLLHSKTRYVSLLNGKANIQFKKTFPVPGEKTSLLHTLKAHLYQCLSKLSEEMYIAGSIVLHLLTQKKNQSPLLPRSSTNVVLPRRGNKEDVDWSCRSMVEISFITTDKSKFSRASYAINSYRVLVEQLERVNITQMGINAQTAFWINVCNSLVMHVKFKKQVVLVSLFSPFVVMICFGHAAIFSIWNPLQCFEKAGPVSQVQAAYNIGGYIISATAIEYSIFYLLTPRSGWSIHRQISKKEAAKKKFLQANVVVKKSKKVFLPKMLERCAKEASIGSDDLLKWVSENVVRAP